MPHREGTMEKRRRRRFTAEYKAEAVKRLEESGKPLRAVADELGVHANQLRGWRNERLAAGSAEALARQKAEAAELARRRRQPPPGLIQHSDRGVQGGLKRLSQHPSAPTAAPHQEPRRAFANRAPCAAGR